MPADSVDVLLRLAVALAIGLLIGVERGWKARELQEGQRTAGLRTFGLIGLAGGLAAILYAKGGAAIIIGGLLGVVTMVAIRYWHTLRDREEVGVTTMIAVIVTYTLGAIAGFGDLEVAGSVGVVVTLLLSIKPELHSILQRIEYRELLATIQLLVISVVLLPILPNVGYGPYAAINPYQIWWMVVAVAGISYIGYFAIRIVGTTRGIIVTGLTGGLVSSTAVTVNLSRFGRDQTAHTLPLLAAGIVIAAATMFPRLIVVVGVFAPNLIGPIAWPVGLAAGVAYIGAGIMAHKAVSRPRGKGGEASKSASKKSTKSAGSKSGDQKRGKDSGDEEADEDLAPNNPFEIKVAIQFGALLAVIMVLARALKEWFGESGVMVLAAISGLGDVDAITLSLASMVGNEEIAIRTAALGVVAAAAANTIVKPALSLALCGWRLAGLVALPLTLSLVAALVGVFVPEWLGLPGAGG